MGLKDSASDAEGAKVRESSGKATVTLSKTFRDGLIYLYQRSDFKKPTWMCRVKVPGGKGYVRPDEGADKFGRKEIADKLRRASKALRESGNTNAAVKVGEIAEAYPDKALMRRRIANSRCAGVRKSAPDRVIFLPFEREGPPGHLAVEIIHISKFAEAAAWADEAHTYFMQHADSAGFFNER